MENSYYRYLSWIVIAVILLIVGFGFGYGYGFSEGIKFAVRVGISFIQIDINEDLMIKMINLYQQFCRKDGVAECLDNLNLNHTINGVV